MTVRYVRRTMTVLAGLLTLVAVSFAAAEEARFTVQPQRALAVARDQTSVNDVPLAQIVATRRKLDDQTLASGLRVEVDTYKAAPRDCPVIDHDVDDGCASLLISAWVDLASATQYALWQVAAPRAMWALAPVQPKRESRAGEYERILLACEPSEEIRSAQKTLQLDDVLMYGTPYRLRIHARLLPSGASSAGRPQQSNVEYEATLDRLSDDVFGGKRYTCTGEPMQ